jgi:predicted DNA-binding transcriptional regulator AlpA
MKKKDKLLPVSIVADRLGLCKQSVYNLICTGDLSAVRIGPKCAIRILESDLRNFLDRRKEEYEEPSPE